MLLEQHQGWSHSGGKRQNADSIHILSTPALLKVGVCMSTNPREHRGRELADRLRIVQLQRVQRTQAANASLRKATSTAS
jgi:hypothetical protein